MNISELKMGHNKQYLDLNRILSYNYVEKNIAKICLDYPPDLNLPTKIKNSLSREDLFNKFNYIKYSIQDYFQNK